MNDELDAKYVIKAATWKGRVNKSRQDRQDPGIRARMHEWDRRIQWAKKHKPRTSQDWVAYRSLKT